MTRHFWGISASALGTYEMITFLSGSRLPTVSNYCARTRARRLALMAWTLGLALHIMKYQA